MSTHNNAKFLAKVSFRLQSTLLSEDFVPDMQIKDDRGEFRKFYYILWDYVPFFDTEVLRWAGKKIGEIAGKSKAEIILGLESSGISIASAAAVLSGLPFGFIRKNPKLYGPGRLIEGQFGRKKKVFLVDNFTATGASFVKAVGICEAEGYKVAGCISVDNFDKLRKVEGFNKLPFWSLSESSIKTEELVKMGYFPGDLPYYVKVYVNKPYDFLEPSEIHNQFTKELKRHRNLKFVF